MPNLKSAKKRARQSEKRRGQNLARKSAVKTAVKKVISSLQSAEDIEVTKKLLREAEAQLSRAKGKGIMHANAAARTISRLAKRVAAKQKST